eukprot:564472-Pyramimonas_sp.AAC.1
MFNRRHRAPCSSLRARPLRVLSRRAPRRPAAAPRLLSRALLPHALPFVSRWNTSWAATFAAERDTDHFDGYEQHSV